MWIQEELVEDVKREWEIYHSDQVEVKALRMVSWGTQMAVVVMLAKVVPNEVGALRSRTGLTIASARLLSNVQRCYKCHTLGHTAARCTVVCPGKEVCSRCGGEEHIMTDCIKEPRCVMCSRHEGASARHITGSLACLMVRVEGRISTRSSTPRR